MCGRVCFSLVIWMSSRKWSPCPQRRRGGSRKTRKPAPPLWISERSIRQMPQVSSPTPLNNARKTRRKKKKKKKKKEKKKKRKKKKEKRKKPPASLLPMQQKWLPSGVEHIEISANNGARFGGFRIVRLTPVGGSAILSIFTMRSAVRIFFFFSSLEFIHLFTHLLFRSFRLVRRGTYINQVHNHVEVQGRELEPFPFLLIASIGAFRLLGAKPLCGQLISTKEHGSSWVVLAHQILNERKRVLSHDSDNTDITEL